ncbi:TcfC E-set like domain-containing protein [Buttiauxella gaviniae]|uniref:TcfC E-set like domain-containing protein n=1 Tax=Buttiauxella gaviniae TaxID=82990 RepID=UPI0039760CB4
MLQKQTLRRLLFGAGCALSFTSQANTQALVAQSAALPDEFRQHFFNVPLAARVQINGEELGDAMIMLSEKNTVQLLEFTDPLGARVDANARKKWAQALARPTALGACVTQCSNNLSALDYSLENARLSIYTTDAAAAGGGQRYHALPENGSSGLTLRNQLNITGGQNQTTAGSWNGDLRASSGNWTSVGALQMDRSGESGAQMRHAVNSLYIERQLPNHFVRSGLFTPDSQGVLRTPYTSGQYASTTLGVMAGSSDSLLQRTDTPSRYPIYATANRNGTVEIYRNGVLINSQPVEAGLQPIDTTRLPTGIYPIEVRVLEDGKVISRSDETVYKPGDWANPQQKLRYNLYAGQNTQFWNDTPQTQQGSAELGASANYLLHPRLTGSVAARHNGNEQQGGLSADWRASETLQLFATGWHSNQTGNGYELQSALSYPQGSLMLNHSKSRRYYDVSSLSNDNSARGLKTDQTSSASLNHRLSGTNALNARVSHHSASSGVSLDVGFTTRQKLLGTDVSWRLSGFDRPYQDGDSQRNRGFALNASFSFGQQGRSASASIGSRSDSRGGRDHFVTASVSQSHQQGFLRQSTASLTADKHGVGLNTYNSFESQPASGSVYLQSSSLDNRLSGGLNLDSTFAAGGGKMALAGAQSSGDTGVIVDVESDDPNVSLVAHHEAGSTPLKAGRNFVPVQAWKAGNIHFDFPGADAPPLKIWPDSHSYHLNRGGVSHHQLRVMKTVTLVGRITEASGQPLAGARIINHAGRSVSESDGFFSLDLHEHTPVISIEHGGVKRCDIQLNPANHRREGDTLLAGNLQCPTSS